MKLGQFHWKYFPKEIILLFLNSVCYESFTSRNTLFPILEISVSFKWLHSIGSNNFPYLTLGLTLWSSWQLPAPVSLPSYRKGVLDHCLILLCISMRFGVWTGFVSQGNSARPSEKRGTCSSHAAKVSRLFFQIKKKGKNKKPNHPEETTSQSTLWIVRGRGLQFQRRIGKHPYYCLQPLSAREGSVACSSTISVNWKIYVTVSNLLWWKTCDWIMSPDDMSQAPSSSLYINVFWGHPV